MIPKRVPSAPLGRRRCAACSFLKRAWTTLAVSYGNDAHGLGGTAALVQIEMNLFAHFQGLKSVPLDLLIVNKNVLSVLGTDKAEAFAFIKPGHGTLQSRHAVLPATNQTGPSGTVFFEYLVMALYAMPPDKRQPLSGLNRKNKNAKKRDAEEKRDG